MPELRECVVIDGVRTPIGKSGWKGMEKGGMFANTSAQDLAGAAMSHLIKKVQKKCGAFNPAEIEDCAMGCLSQIGEQAGNLGRLIPLLVDLPEEIAGWTVDRYCNAGLQAINAQAHAIMVGSGDIMIAGGVEHMSHYPMGSARLTTQGKYPFMKNRMFKMKKSFIMMGQSAELVAQKYGLTREDLDNFGAWSHQKAVTAMRDKEWYKQRIAPVETLVKRVNETGEKVKETIIRDTDETPRTIYLDNPEVAREKLQKLKPRFNYGNNVCTAGNSSQIVDGAAAVLLMSREKADELGLKPMASIVSTAVAGSEPIIMLLGPIPAQQKALKRAGKTMDDMQIIEPNEAFASPCLAFAKEFNYAFQDPRVNPTGGAIAIGHPIGASGVIYFIEMVWEMVRQNMKWGIQTLCGGGGVGIATVVKRD